MVVWCGVGYPSSSSFWSGEAEPNAGLEVLDGVEVPERGPGGVCSAEPLTAPAPAGAPAGECVRWLTIGYDELWGRV